MNRKQRSKERWTRRYVMCVHIKAHYTQDLIEKCVRSVKWYKREMRGAWC